jgi:hypothetical protein
MEIDLAINELGIGCGEYKSELVDDCRGRRCS